MNKYLLNGDLSQMAAQKRFLINKGFEVDQVDVYPAIYQEDVQDALNEIYLNSVDGWWCYQEDLLKYSICSKDDYIKKLRL